MIYSNMDSYSPYGVPAPEEAETTQPSAEARAKALRNVVAGALRRPRTRRGLGNVVGDFRRLEYLEDIESAAAQYEPRPEDMPGIVEDLGQVSGALANFIRTAPAKSESEFYRERDVVMNALFPHGAIAGRLTDLGLSGSEPYAAYVKAYAQAQELVNETLAVQSPAQVSAAYWEGLASVSNGLQQAIEYAGAMAMVPLQAIGQGAQAVGEGLQAACQWGEQKAKEIGSGIAGAGKWTLKTALFYTAGGLVAFGAVKLIVDRLFERSNPLLMKVNPCEEEKKNC